MTSEDKKRHKKSPYYLDSGGGWDLSGISTGASASDAGLTILLLILIMVGVAILAYFIALAFANLITFGEVHKASMYSKKVRRYSIEEWEGYSLARRLTKTNIYFSVVLFVFTSEEAIRYVLHTGPATIEIWWFRIACLAIFIIILGAFFVRLSRWHNFKSTRNFLKASDEIRQCEQEGIALYRKK